MRGTLGWLLTLLAVAGCDSPESPIITSPVEPTSTLTESQVTGEAVQSLTNGIFPQRASSDRDVIGPERAKDLAWAYLETFGPYMRSSFERQHGGAIDLSALEAVDRVLLAESPYSAPEGATPPLRNVLGDYYIVVFRNRLGVPTISVGVAANATDVEIVDGAIQYPLHSGNEFRPQGIPAGIQAPLTPERAANLAISFTGAPVVAAPRLWQRGPDWFPQFGVWQVEVEDAVEPTFIDWNGALVEPVPPRALSLRYRELDGAAKSIDLNPKPAAPTFPHPQGGRK